MLMDVNTDMIEILFTCHLYVFMSVYSLPRIGDMLCNHQVMAVYIFPILFINKKHRRDSNPFRSEAAVIHLSRISM